MWKISINELELIAHDVPSIEISQKTLLTIINTIRIAKNALEMVCDKEWEKCYGLSAIKQIESIE